MVKHIKTILNVVFLFVILQTLIFAQTYESISILNNTNFVRFINNSYFTSLKKSNGDIHFTPIDIYLLAKVLQEGVTVEVMADYTIPKYSLETLEVFSDIVDFDNIKSYERIFRENDVKIEIYPAINKAVVLVNDSPYVQLKVSTGPTKEFSRILRILKDDEIYFNDLQSFPTTSNRYETLEIIQDYISNSNPSTTIIPFGTVITHEDRIWKYEYKGKTFSLPEEIATDLELAYAERKYNYLDIKIDPKTQKTNSAIWAGHPFGKYTITLYKANNTNPTLLFYSPGEYVYEQENLIKNLSRILTIPEEDTFDEVILSNPEFSYYKDINTFITSLGSIEPTSLNSTECSYYRLFNDFKLTDKDYQNIDQRITDSFNAYVNNKNYNYGTKKQIPLSIFTFLEENSQNFEKKSNFYNLLKNNWELLKELKIKLRTDFEDLNIFSKDERAQKLKDWMTERLEFKKIKMPFQKSISLYTFFKKEKSVTLLPQDQKDHIKNLISKELSKNDPQLVFYSTSAINNYNFGVLLNKMLGNLYKSHGCLHVSPRDSFLLYQSIPLNSKVFIHNYFKAPDKNKLDALPYLANLINFKDDLDNLAKDFSSKPLSIEVYPFTGDWIINLNDKPFCKLSIKGGPKEKMYYVDSWDEKGTPIFKDNMAYPTSSGLFYIFQKTENYLSTTYKDTTIIPQGAILRKDKNKWLFIDEKGILARTPQIIEEDLSNSLENQEFRYYDNIYNKKGKLIETKWGSNDFGKFCLLLSKNKKSKIPEVIHSSGDLIMEQRALVDDLIEVLAASDDELDYCIKYNDNFSAYKVCYEFTKNPEDTKLPDPYISGSYKLYYDIDLSKEEKKALPLYVIVANKIIKKIGKLSKEEKELLTNSSLAKIKKGKLIIDIEKIKGIHFSTYQYVVAIEKSANHYLTLKEKWKDLTDLRKAMIKDFERFIIKDPKIFKKFIAELILRRINLQEISNRDVLVLLNDLINKN